ncbi:DNA methyltransferase [Mycolicibacterium fortuitum]|uniref:DNA methyltransferase n=1 Tax=Mycolicibacterium fortuitum TaxID=1766 RepID=A0AAE5AFY1_MYCFO|nr:DNA methyltransferase [Mycolicibacterium fortuitum]MDV7194769.1 DNA methyltransferase [Mycolicibacterium fortuitum]MDV7207672.1 DNA methyltransferase [Mycolicibacterium fortuitum]MDV7229728.1 DNA methyltransferase [Mycolicibacterium fortuitum]MDV7261519.1 DNA methyltransferase [Mycolicibacterium fortuitum]MDV7286701.1 DNA methyltransferase [Mycolicibacterium fortuitum]
MNVVLTEDQARLLWRHAGGWMLAAAVVDPDYGISSLKSRAGGKAWPDGSHPELPYNHTWTTNSGIIGHASGLKDEPAVSVSFNAIRNWADTVPEPIKTELRLQFQAMADERNRTMNWCRCHFANGGEIKSHKDFMGRDRYHPSAAEDQRHRDIEGGLDARQDEWVLKSLGLADQTADDAPQKPYAEFLADKVQFDRALGHTIADADIHPRLFPHQRDIVRWAVAGGRRAVFAAFGLGKSVLQIETIRLTIAERGGRGLIVCPLGVRQEFVHDAAMLDTTVRFVRSADELDDTGIYLTNYETIRDGKLDPALFTAVSLDEAGVLRSFGSKTYQSFLSMFDAVPYRFVATATPSPNRYKELIHYAAFLGIMDSGQALTRWFKRDSTKANNLTLHPHLADQFHYWLATWAVFLNRPGELGHSDAGYDLPEMSITYHEVDVDHSDTPSDRDGQGFLYRGGALGVSDVAREKRDSLPARVEEMCRIVDTYEDADDADQFVIWCDLNVEQDAIEKALEDIGYSFSSVHGALSTEESERRIAAWKNRETQFLIGKPVMLGQGLNLQQCNKAIFVGVTYKFHDTIQACHRIQRFGQQRSCHTHIIHAESEREVVRALREKWSQHNELRERMSAIITEIGLDPANVAKVLKRSIGVERIEVSGDGWLMANNDCIPETAEMEADSVDLIVTSIPFANHYQYTHAVEDLGFTDDNQHFWEQMDYLTPQLLRILAPGRIYACHVKDRINFGNVTGAGVPTVSPFHAEAIAHATKHGFDYCGLIFVDTDVVRENNQTYRLTYSEMCKDSTKMGVGSPEFVLLFHKPQTDRSRGYADTPVMHDKMLYSLARWQINACSRWRSSGDRLVAPEQWAALSVSDMKRMFTEQSMQEIYDFESHIAIGEHLEGRSKLPKTFTALQPGSSRPDVWHDVNRMLTLNTTQAAKGREMHICPLQLDIVDRLIEQYSNPGELVFDPFGGLGTVPVRAIKAGRRGRAVELNAGYYFDAVGYLQAEERKRDMPTLFDLEAEAS